MSCIYQKAEMMIYPSIFEGFGIPILEALNSQIPVITTKGGCFSEAVEKFIVRLIHYQLIQFQMQLLKLNKIKILKIK